MSELGHEVVRAREVALADASDAAVLQYACDHGCVLITCNRDDFVALAGQHAHHGIVVVIRRRTRAAERASLLRLLSQAGEVGLRQNINFA